jgi:hypothetical protein
MLEAPQRPGQSQPYQATRHPQIRQHRLIINPPMSDIRYDDDLLETESLCRRAKRNRSILTTTMKFRLRLPYPPLIRLWPG